MGSDNHLPEIPTVRLLGTTWYTRGFGYWCRRVGVTLLYTIAFLSTALFAAAALDDIQTEAHGWVRIVLLAIAVTGIVWSFISAFLSLRRTPEERAAGRPIAFRPKNTKDGRRTGGAAGLGLGVGAFGGSTVAGGLLLIGAVFVVGWIAAWVATSLGRYLSVEEFEAVQKLGTRP